MSQQTQIFIMKQGSIQKDNWSSRILTLDTETATATVSRRNNPEKVLHHTLRINDIIKFPQVDLTQTKIDRNSIEAKWTLCLLGNKAPAPPLPVEEVRIVDPYSNDINEGPAGERHSSDSSDTPTPSPTKEAKKTSARSGKGEGKAAQRWLIRCTSQDTYDLAVKLLEHMKDANSKEQSERPQDGSNAV